MAQLFFLALIALIIYFLADTARKLLSYKFKSPRTPKPEGDIIDISEAWIDLGNLPYTTKPRMLPDKELRLYGLLTDVINKQTAVVVPKAHLSEILDLMPSASQRAEYARRLKERSVDFLVCTRQDMAPRLGIITESRNEGESQRQNRKFVEQAAQMAGLPLLILDINQLPGQSPLAAMLQNAGLSLEIDESYLK